MGTLSYEFFAKSPNQCCFKVFIILAALATASLNIMAQSLDKMQWFNEPDQWEIKGDTLSMVVPPHTDYWRVALWIHRRRRSFLLCRIRRRVRGQSQGVGFALFSPVRTTGNGYHKGCVVGPDNILIEITALLPNNRLCITAKEISRCFNTLWRPGLALIMQGTDQYHYVFILHCFKIEVGRPRSKIIMESEDGS